MKWGGLPPAVEQLLASSRPVSDPFTINGRQAAAKHAIIRDENFLRIGAAGGFAAWP